MDMGLSQVNAKSDMDKGTQLVLCAGTADPSSALDTAAEMKRFARENAECPPADDAVGSGVARNHPQPSQGEPRVVRRAVPAVVAPAPQDKHLSFARSFRGGARHQLIVTNVAPHVARQFDREAVALPEAGGTSMPASSEQDCLQSPCVLPQAGEAREWAKQGLPLEPGEWSGNRIASAGDWTIATSRGANRRPFVCKPSLMSHYHTAPAISTLEKAASLRNAQPCCVAKGTGESGADITRLGVTEEKLKNTLGGSALQPFTETDCADARPCDTVEVCQDGTSGKRTSEQPYSMGSSLAAFDNRMRTSHAFEEGVRDGPSTGALDTAISCTQKLLQENVSQMNCVFPMDTGFAPRLDGSSEGLEDDEASRNLMNFLAQFSIALDQQKAEGFQAGVPPESVATSTHEVPSDISSFLTALAKDAQFRSVVLGQSDPAWFRPLLPKLLLLSSFNTSGSFPSPFAVASSSTVHNNRGPARAAEPGTQGSAVLSPVSSLLGTAEDSRAFVQDPPHISGTAAGGGFQQQGVLGQNSSSDVIGPLEGDGRYTFDAELRCRHTDGSGTLTPEEQDEMHERGCAGGRAPRPGRSSRRSRKCGTEYVCTYPGVSWNTRMQSWLVYFEDAGGRKSRTFNPKRLTAGQLEMLPLAIRKKADKNPVEVAMHCACVYAARVRWEGRLRKSLGSGRFHGTQSGRCSSTRSSSGSDKDLQPEARSVLVVGQNDEQLLPGSSSVSRCSDRRSTGLNGCLCSGSPRQQRPGEEFQQPQDTHADIESDGLQEFQDLKQETEKTDAVTISPTKDSTPFTDVPGSVAASSPTSLLLSSSSSASAFVSPMTMGSLELELSGTTPSPWGCGEAPKQIATPDREEAVTHIRKDAREGCGEDGDKRVNRDSEPQEENSLHDRICKGGSEDVPANGTDDTLTVLHLEKEDDDSGSKPSPVHTQGVPLKPQRMERFSLKGLGCWKTPSMMGKLEGMKRGDNHVESCYHSTLLKHSGCCGTCLKMQRKSRSQNFLFSETQDRECKGTSEGRASAIAAENHACKSSATSPRSVLFMRAREVLQQFLLQPRNSQDGALTHCIAQSEASKVEAKREDQYQETQLGQDGQYSQGSNAEDTPSLKGVREGQNAGDMNILNNVPKELSRLEKPLDDSSAAGLPQALERPQSGVAVDKESDEQKMCEAARVPPSITTTCRRRVTSRHPNCDLQSQELGNVVKTENAFQNACNLLMAISDTIQRAACEAHVPENVRMALQDQIKSVLEAQRTMEREDGDFASALSVLSSIVPSGWTADMGCSGSSRQGRRRGRGSGGMMESSIGGPGKRRRGSIPPALRFGKHTGAALIPREFLSRPNGSVLRNTGVSDTLLYPAGSCPLLGKDDAAAAVPPPPASPLPRYLDEAGLEEAADSDLAKLVQRVLRATGDTLTEARDTTVDILSGQTIPEDITFICQASSPQPTLEASEKGDDGTSSFPCGASSAEDPSLRTDWEACVDSCTVRQIVEAGLKSASSDFNILYTVHIGPSDAPEPGCPQRGRRRSKRLHEREEERNGAVLGQRPAKRLSAPDGTLAFYSAQEPIMNVEEGASADGAKRYRERPTQGRQVGGRLSRRTEQHSGKIQDERYSGGIDSGDFSPSSLENRPMLHGNGEVADTCFTRDGESALLKEGLCKVDGKEKALMSRTETDVCSFGGTSDANKACNGQFREPRALQVRRDRRCRGDLGEPPLSKRRGRATEGTGTRRFTSGLKEQRYTTRSTGQSGSADNPQMPETHTVLLQATRIALS